MEDLSYATFVNKEGKIIKRTPTTVFTRVMGYLSPVRLSDGGSQYNIGKRSEFYSRKYFNVDIASKSPYLMARENAMFNEKYSSIL